MTKASQVPAMVLAHQEGLQSTAYFTYATRFFASAIDGRKADSPGKYTPEQIERGIAWCRTEADRLNISRLFHITESMTEVAKIAAMRLPPELVLDHTILPSVNGVLVFEHPLYFRDVWNRVIGISMANWQTYSSGRELALGLYTDVNDPGDQYNLVMKAKGTLNNRAGQWSLTNYDTSAKRTIGPWSYGDEQEIDDYRAEHEDMANYDTFTQYEQSTIPLTVPSFTNVYSILYAICALMDQSITDVSEETDRRLQRRNRDKKRSPPMVTVIQLRRRDQHGTTDSASGRFLTYRSVTSGHWRNQPCGPGRSEVRRIWIHPYIRGGEDLPLWQPKRVSTLRR